MNFKEFHEIMKKDEGYLIMILMLGYAVFMCIGAVGWIMYLSHFL